VHRWLIPLNRLNWSGAHYISADAAEISRLTAAGWANEGVLGCVSPSNIANCSTSALHKLSTPTAFWSSSASEIATVVRNGGIDMGAIAYVWSGP
jgi:hypothetical protein